MAMMETFDLIRDIEGMQKDKTDRRRVFLLCFCRSGHKQYLEMMKKRAEKYI